MVSIRAKLIFSFLIFLCLCTTISIGAIWMLSKIEEKIFFLEIANSYMVEIQQARRYEKNYLLYGTNLEDASEHLKAAKAILDKNRETIQKILGKEHSKTMLQYMTKYSDQIAQLGSNTHSDTDVTNLREYGSQMVAFAEEFVTKERDVLGHMILFSKRAPLIFIVIILGCTIAIITTLMRHLLLSLNRFMDYTKRIGDGDFSQITIGKDSRDEFSKLANAFNHMVKELDNRHAILVQSHKLRAVGTLVAGVAHELNNPLNNSMLTASVLKEDFATLTDTEKNEMIDDLIHETERSQRIVKDLLDFARESETNMQPLHIKEILNDSIRLTANQVRMSKVSLKGQFDEDLPMVHGDEQMLKQVFVNMIINAVDALPPGGVIQISTHRHRHPGYVTVDITDNGTGIPEHIQSRVFEPFFSTKSNRGVGLGLSVSRGIIQKLDGFITLKSVPGVGTTFSVSIPTTDLPACIMSSDSETKTKNCIT